MAGWLIDTSVLIDAERGGGALSSLARVPREGEHAISVISASELVHGIHRAVDAGVQMRRRAFVEGVLSELEALPITLEVARVHAGIWAQLEAVGEIIGAHDLWIAATALTHGLRVATSNAREFERVPGLSVLAL
jgi:tRNA(fMet)-specific endonuclease VapC